MKAQGGFTLIELVVVVVITSILLTMATLYFSRMNEKYRAESSTKEIYTLLMKARNDATTTNTRHLVALAAKQVQFGRDADNNNIIDGTPITTQYPQYTINFSASPIAFDRRGLTNNIQTISITIDNSVGATPAIDCIVVSSTRINIGKMNGANCVQQ